jgi:hypothetical protein
MLEKYEPQKYAYMHYVMGGFVFVFFDSWSRLKSCEM